MHVPSTAQLTGFWITLACDVFGRCRWTFCSRLDFLEYRRLSVLKKCSCLLIDLQTAQGHLRVLSAAGCSVQRVQWEKCRRSAQRVGWISRVMSKCGCQGSHINVELFMAGSYGLCVGSQRVGYVCEVGGGRRFCINNPSTALVCIYTQDHDCAGRNI